MGFWSPPKHELGTFLMKMKNVKRRKQNIAKRVDKLFGI